MVYMTQVMAVTIFTLLPSDWQESEGTQARMPHHTCLWGTKVSKWIHVGDQGSSGVNVHWFVTKTQNSKLIKSTHMLLNCVVSYYFKGMGFQSRLQFRSWLHHFLALWFGGKSVNLFICFVCKMKKAVIPNPNYLFEDYEIMNINST